VPRHSIRSRAGFTLAEMLVVVALVALGASVAMPNAGPLTAVTNDLAASEVIRAIRFAQREAIRTSAWYTVQIDANAQTLRVYRLTSSGTVTEDTSFIVQNPIDKMKYDLGFSAAGGPARAVIAAVDFDYAKGSTNQNTLSFGPDGVPGMLQSFKSGDDVALQAGTVTITYGNVQRTLTVDVLTGRVSG
jgi:prepilin-type N-terminal cleavage/methylation domain-containing protein